MGPLSGLRVVELAGIGPGPMCAMLLGDQGADVVRIDRLVDSGLGLELDPRCDITSRNRRSIAIDLKSESGRAVALKLIAGADLLIEPWRPGVAERLGLGPAACLAANPRLIYGRMSGYGQDGPLAREAGHDIDYIALTGALHAIGDRDPVPPLNLVGDYGGGALYLAFGLLAALHERDRSGLGQVVDAAMVDGAASLMSIFHGLAAQGAWNPEQRYANAIDGGAPNYSVYRCADGRHLALGALEGKFFANFLRRVGLDESWVARRNQRAAWPEMRAAIAARLLERGRDEWCALLEGADACVAPVLTLAEAPSHPHAQARGTYVEVDGVVQPAPAPRFSRLPAATPRSAPRVGEHGRELLAEAGFAADEIAGLLAAGVVMDFVSH